MAGLDAVREKLEEIKLEASGRRVGQVEKIFAHVSEALALLESVEGERMRRHEPWCNSHKLALCSGCSVKKGWDRNGLTGERTKCRHGSPHEWLFEPCTCGLNDQRRGDRRRQGAILAPTESEHGEHR